MPGCRSTGLLCKAGYLSPEEALPGPAAWLLGWSQPASLFGVRESRTCVCLCLAMQLRAYIYLGLAQAENMCLLARKKRPPTAGSSPLLYQAVCTFPRASQACVPWDWRKQLQSLVISQSESQFAEVALFNYGFITIQSWSVENACHSKLWDQA